MCDVRVDIAIQSMDVRWISYADYCILATVCWLLYAR
jgi:hypothetical protein